MPIYSTLRRLLFRLDPERAHALSLGLARFAGWPPVRFLLRTALAPSAGRRIRVFGLEFANPIGLAAGYDKDGVAWRGMACLGFGHVEIGTVTPRPQPGNPRPRVFRLEEDRSLVNRLGFPSRGARFVAARLASPRPTGLVLGVNLGKQKETPLEHAVEDYDGLIGVFAPLADYLVINVSSPNTPGLRRLQEGDSLGPLLAQLVERRRVAEQDCGRRVPLLVKLSPDLDDHELESALETIASAGIDGVIATNTSVDRAGLRSALAGESGGLSGAALTARSTQIVRRIHERTSGKLPIVACGGVMNADDARAKLDAGASLVQLYTGLVYEGPGLVRRIVEATSAESRGQ